MIAALLLAIQAAPAATTAAPAQSAVDAERAFAADAQKLGQWTAFRKWSASDALMFTPKAGKAHDFLKDLKDPPTAVFWWPGRSYVSCDGNTAINTGPWVRQWGKSVGYFTTVWKRQSDGNWKWLLDHGDTLETPRAEGGDIKARIASCQGRPFALPPLIGLKGSDLGSGRSADGTLLWGWTVRPDGSRSFKAHLWTGLDWRIVIDDSVKVE